MKRLTSSLHRLAYRVAAKLVAKHNPKFFIKDGELYPATSTEVYNPDIPNTFDSDVAI